MGLQEDIQASPATMLNWLKTRAGVIASLVTIVTGWGVLSGTVNSAWTDMVGAGVAPHLEKITASQEANTERDKSILTQLAAIERRLAAIEELQSSERDPVMRFARSGHSISNAAIGDFSRLRWAYFRLRDECGPPSVGLFFRDSAGADHRFDNPSVASISGRGTASEALPSVLQTIRYPARIPSENGAQAGPAVGWAEVWYPACPLVPVERSPETAFIILPEGEQ